MERVGEKIADGRVLKLIEGDAPGRSDGQR